MCTLIRSLRFWVDRSFFLLLLLLLLTYLYCLVGCLSTIVWTRAVWGVLYVCVLNFCICTSSAQLSMFYAKRRSGNIIIIIIVVVVIIIITVVVVIIIISSNQLQGFNFRQSVLFSDDESVSSV